MCPVGDGSTAISLKTRPTKEWGGSNSPHSYFSVYRAQGTVQPLQGPDRAPGRALGAVEETRCRGTSRAAGAGSPVATSTATATRICCSARSITRPTRGLTRGTPRSCARCRYRGRAWPVGSSLATTCACWKTGPNAPAELGQAGLAFGEGRGTITSNTAVPDEALKR